MKTHKKIIFSALSLLAYPLSWAQTTPQTVFKYTFENDDAVVTTVDQDGNEVTTGTDGTAIEPDYKNGANGLVVVTNQSGQTRFSTARAASQGGHRARIVGTLFDPANPGVPSNQALALEFDSYDVSASAPYNSGFMVLQQSGAGLINTEDNLVYGSDGMPLTDPDTGELLKKFPLGDGVIKPSMTHLLANPRDYVFRMKIGVEGYDGTGNATIPIAIGYDSSGDVGFVTTSGNHISVVPTAAGQPVNMNLFQRRFSDLVAQRLTEVNPERLNIKVYNNTNTSNPLSNWGNTAANGVNNRIIIDDVEIIYSPLPVYSPTLNFGNTGVYEQNFNGITDPVTGVNALVIPNGWTTPGNYWSIKNQPLRGIEKFIGTNVGTAGANGVLNTSTNTVEGRYRNSGTGGTITAPAGTTYPIDPVKKAESYSSFEYLVPDTADADMDGNTTELIPAVDAGGNSLPYTGFQGGWLANNALSSNNTTATTYDPALAATERVAKLQLTNLPQHDTIDVELLLATGGSYDGLTDTAGNNTGNQSRDYNFRINVRDRINPDNPDYVTQTSPGGNNNPTEYQLARLTSLANLTNQYGEQWVIPAGQSEPSPAALGWTVHSAYDLSRLSVLKDIAHSSNNLTVDFLHGLDSDSTDEIVAIENVKITLKLNGQVVTGTSPAALEITTVAGGLPSATSSLTVVFKSVAGKNYEWQASDNLATGQWTTISSSPIPATGTSTTVVIGGTAPGAIADPNAAGKTQRFYRVRELP